MSAESKKTRRDFIRTATVAAATAAATGLGATTVVAESTTDTSITLQQVTRLSNTGAGNHQSLALKRQISNTCLSDSVQIPPKTAPKSAARLTSLQLENSELTEQLLILQADSENFQTDSGKLQADNERLQIELDAAIAQKEQLDDLLSNNTSLIESLARQLDTANNNLSESTEQVTKLTNVILLYQSLDKVDIENAAEDGLENFHGHISSLHNGATILQSKLST